MLVLAAANCTRAPEQRPEPPPGALQGIYYSDDDHGVLVFLSDGTFGYKFAAHLAFVYNEQNLPPDRGRYVLLPDGAVKVSGAPGTDLPFALQVSKDKSMILLTRAAPGPESYGLGLPAKAKYTKKLAGES